MPYAIKPLLKVSQAPYHGYFLPFAVSLYKRAGVSNIWISDLNSDFEWISIITCIVLTLILTITIWYNSNLLYITVDLFTGILVSDCLLPCLRTAARVIKKTNTKMINRKSRIFLRLNFDNQVRVKRISVDQFSFTRSLNFFGSNLGLWPGLGLYQVLEWLMGIIFASQLLVKSRHFRL